MELKLARLRRWLFALCQARSGQCLKQSRTPLNPVGASLLAIAVVHIQH